MRAMSVLQPWAWAICHGGKPLENRTEKSNVLRQARKSIGELVAIHTGVRPPTLIEWQHVRDMARHHPGAPPLPTSALLPTGAIVGVARIVGVVDDRQGAIAAVGAGVRWWAGPHAIVLAEAQPLHRHIPAKGFLYLWELKPDDAADIAAQLAEAA